LRVTPRCRHFGTCGGCSLQHLAPKAQLDFKQRQLLENLTRIGQVTPQRVLEPLAGPVWNYRRRARLGVKHVARKGRVLVGFRERSAPYVADLVECPVLEAPVDRLLEPLAALIDGLSIASRVPQIEVAVAPPDTALVLRVLDPPGAADRDRLAEFERDYAVRLYLQPGGPETVTPLTVGKPQLAYRLPDQQLSISFEPTDFIQVNATLNQAMIDHALTALAPRPTDAVLDLFCGLGNFSLPLACRSRRVVGVEGAEELVARARANAEANGIDNAEFHRADLMTPVEGAAWARNRYDLALLDPPRAGAREILPTVVASGARRIVYVSCHPGSLARDAGLLVSEHGYTLAAAGVMDMFPHTNHVEAIAVFERSPERQRDARTSDDRRAGTELTAEDRRVLRHPLVGAVILFTRNYATPGSAHRARRGDPCAARPAAARHRRSRSGRVQRFRSGFTELPPQRAIVTLTTSIPRRASARVAMRVAAGRRVAGNRHRSELCAVCRPRLRRQRGDRRSRVPSRPGDRRAARDCGPAGNACGRDDGDRQALPWSWRGRRRFARALPVDRRALAELGDRSAAVPRLVANGLAGVMVAHVLFPEIDEYPASFSRRWIQDELRWNLGFTGAVFSDDLSMEGAAVIGSVPNAPSARWRPAATCSPSAMTGLPCSATLDALADAADP
jgi:23S rRNA (uracil1939-C5)-methyltransferase